MSTLIQLIARILGNKTDFQNLFFRNELRALFGKRNSGLLMLGLIFLLTWLALGYALGSLETLRKRMDNPYTNWVDWPVPYGKDNQDRRRALGEYMKDSTARDSYYLAGINDYSRESRVFRHRGTGEQYYMNCRTLEPTEALYKRILDEKEHNVLGGTTYKGNDEQWDVPSCGLIVKEEMLERLGYDNPAGQQMIPVSYTDSITVYLPVVAVVKELPSLCDYVCTPRLFNLLTTENFVYRPSGATNHHYLLASERDASKVEQTLRAILSQKSVRKVEQEPLQISNTETRYIYTIGFEDSYEPEELDTMLQTVRQQWPSNSPQPEAYFKPNCSQSKYDVLENPYYVAFNFSKLYRIQPFKELLKRQFGIELSMDQIEAKKNFALVSWLTYLISLVLFGFSIASIILFINNKLTNHLEQNKPNLGTFKAFGLSNQQLTRLYSSIILAFLLLGFGAAALVAILFAGLNKILPFSIITLFDPKIALAFLLLFAICLAVSIRTINTILKDTPGNLIYGR